MRSLVSVGAPRHHGRLGRIPLKAGPLLPPRRLPSHCARCLPAGSHRQAPVLLHRPRRGKGRGAQFDLQCPLHDRAAAVVTASRGKRTHPVGSQSAAPGGHRSVDAPAAGQAVGAALDIPVPLPGT